MALKLVKVTIPMEVKADLSDPDDLKHRIYESLQVLLESEELEYVLGDDEEELDGEEL